MVMLFNNFKDCGSQETQTQQKEAWNIKCCRVGPAFPWWSPSRITNEDSM